MKLPLLYRGRPKLKRLSVRLSPGFLGYNPVWLSGGLCADEQNDALFRLDGNSSFEWDALEGTNTGRREQRRACRLFGVAGDDDKTFARRSYSGGLA